MNTCKRCGEEYEQGRWGDELCCPQCYKELEKDVEGWLNNRDNDMSGEELD
jgi:protein-arginine kinase activator protein McsA